MGFAAWTRIVARPEPLPAEEPVAELVVDGGAADAGRRQIGGDLRDKIIFG